MPLAGPGPAIYPLFGALDGYRIAVDPSNALVATYRRAWGGPGDGAAAVGLDSAPGYA